MAIAESQSCLKGVQAAKCALIVAPEILPSGAIFGTKLGNKEL